MSKKDEIPQKNALDYPSISEREWYVLAIASACITLVVAIWLLLWVFYGETPILIGERISISGAIVTFCGATTTFCTVAWRGLINSRQADTANDQIREVRKQIQESVAQGERVERQLLATDINNQALLLEKAAVLIADEKTGKQMAGISLLRHLGIASDAPFKSEAINLLKEFLLRRFIEIRATQHENHHYVYDYVDYNALIYLDDIADEKITSRAIPIKIRNGNVQRLPKNLRAVTFVQSGFIYVSVNNSNISFIDSKFVFSSIDYDGYLKGNNLFEQCKITNIKIDPEGTAVFESCDFSGCKTIDALGRASFLDCYYDEAFPPAADVLLNFHGEIDVQKKTG